MERLTNREGDGLNCSFVKRCIMSIEGVDVADELLKKLSYYENAEEGGRLLILPCAIGTPIFEIFKANIYNGLGVLSETVIQIEEHDFSLEWCGRLDDFGKTIFLNREDAEQRKMKMEKAWNRIKGRQNR